MINRNDAYYLQRLSGKLMTKFIPLKIKERFYLIPKKMYIHNQKLFSIVLDGNYLDTNNKNIWIKNKINKIFYIIDKKCFIYEIYL